jgi:hypothetical protein
MAQHEEIHPSEPSVMASLGRVIETGQRTILNRIDLAKLDVIATVKGMLRSGLFVGIGAVLAAVGWLALTAAAILFANEYFSMPASAAIVGLVNAIVGGALIVVGTQRAKSEASNRPANGR